MLVSSLLYFIMQKSNTIFASFFRCFLSRKRRICILKRGDDLQLHRSYCKRRHWIISLILAITHGGSDYDDSEENYDEALKTIMPRKNLTIKAITVLENWNLKAERYFTGIPKTGRLAFVFISFHCTVIFTYITIKPNHLERFHENNFNLSLPSLYFLCV